MPPSKARNLRLLDPSTGEISQCAGCHQWERTYNELERKYRGALSQIGNLRADKDEEARQHELWPKAFDLFDLWRNGTGKKKARWTGDRFWLVQPFLAQDERDCRYAIYGLLDSDYHMKRGDYKNRKGPRYDEFERPFKSQADFERFRDMANKPDPKTIEFFEWIDEGRAAVAAALAERSLPQ